MGEVTRQCADWRRMNEGRWPASTAKENFQPRSVWLETEWCKGWSGYDRKDANLITPEECKIQKKWMFEMFTHMGNMVWKVREIWVYLGDKIKSLESVSYLRTTLTNRLHPTKVGTWVWEKENPISVTRKQTNKQTKSTCYHT